MEKKYFYFIIILIFLGCSVSKEETERSFKKSSSIYDAIIIPGIPYENKTWSNIMKARIYWSKYLYDYGITKNIIYSGSAVYTPYYESKIMALYAQELGIPDSVIFTETKAEHSTENVYYSYQLAKQMGFKKIALATDPVQSFMLKPFVSKTMKSSVDLIPIVFRKIQEYKKKDTVDLIIDDISAYDSNFVSIVKEESYFQRLKATFGKSIDYE